MGGLKKGIWIARDQDGELCAYAAKPNKRKCEFVPRCNRVKVYGWSIMQLPTSWYKNIKFENSPVFVPLTEDFVKQFIKN